MRLAAGVARVCVAQVLRFYGWLKQTVHESQLEHYRVRHVKLYYYLEDDSIEIIEPHVRDSGMPQGRSCP